MLGRFHQSGFAPSGSLLELRWERSEKLHGMLPGSATERNIEVPRNLLRMNTPISHRSVRYAEFSLHAPQRKSSEGALECPIHYIWSFHLETCSPPKDLRLIFIPEHVTECRYDISQERASMCISEVGFRPLLQTGGEVHYYA
jgi:hypothetical protein